MGAISTATGVLSTKDPISPLSLQILPGDESSERQRTTRGRSRQVSTGPASSGSFNDADSLQQHVSKNSIEMIGSSSTEGVDVKSVSSLKIS